MSPAPNAEATAVKPFRSERVKQGHGGRKVGARHRRPRPRPLFCQPAASRPQSHGFHHAAPHPRHARVFSHHHKMVISKRRRRGVWSQPHAVRPRDSNAVHAPGVHPAK